MITLRQCKTIFCQTIAICICLFCASPSVLGLELLQDSQDGRDTGKKQSLPLSTKVVMDPKYGVVIREQSISKVSWKNEAYDVDDGIAVLMSVVRNPSSAKAEREEALDRLGMLSTQLDGRNCVEELIALYGAMRTRKEKGGLLLCLTKSQDRRGLPLLYEVVEAETDPVVRLFAALGLAKWNVRRGVAELVGLFESREILTSSRMPNVRDYALESFRNANARKGWGCSEEEIRKSIERRTDFNDEQKAALYIAEIKKWFAENEERFPNWNPSDPLPEAPGEAPKPKDSE